MTIGLVGRKVGMTRIFTDDGGTLPVTVLDVSDNRITQIKTAEKDGYAAVQVAFGKRRASRVNKAARRPSRQGRRRSGPRAARNSAAKPEELGELKVGGKIRRRAALQGRPAGGRAGRDDRQGLRRRHQAPPLRRPERLARQLDLAPSPGSTGQNQSPAHVFPGKRMPGHLGNAKRTIAEPRDRAHRRRAPAAAGEGLGARLERARCRGALAIKGQRRGELRRPRPRARRSKPAAKPAKPAAKPARRKRSHGTQDDRRQGRRRHVARRPTTCSAATSTRRWCTRSWSPSRPTRASARARRRIAARCAIRPRSRGGRRAPAARAPA